MDNLNRLRSSFINKKYKEEITGRGQLAGTHNVATFQTFGHDSSRITERFIMVETAIVRSIWLNSTDEILEGAKDVLRKHPPLSIWAAQTHQWLWVEEKNQHGLETPLPHACFLWFRRLVGVLLLILPHCFRIILNNLPSEMFTQLFYSFSTLHVSGHIRRFFKSLQV